MNDYSELYTKVQKKLRAKIVFAHGNSKLTPLKEMSANDINKIIPMTLLRLITAIDRGNNAMVSVSRAVANDISLSYSCPNINNINDQIIIGCAALEVLAEVGAISKTNRFMKQSSKYETACISINDNDLVQGLFDIALEQWDLNSKAGILPSTTPHADWTSVINDNGVKIVRKGDRGYVNDNIVQNQYNMLNTKQPVGWVINKEMLNFYNKFKANKNNVVIKDELGNIIKSGFSFHTEKDQKSRISKKLLAYNIINIAKLIGDNVFYHQYTYDFRGRSYPNTALLHEQGDDTARGLFDFVPGKPLGGPNKEGRDGYDAVLFNASSAYGYDKDTRDGRIQFAKDNLTEWVGFGKDPIHNKGWINADKPLQFLRFCLELYNISTWVNSGNAIEDFVSGCVCGIDSTTSGAQIMGAITLDSKLGAEVNLTKSNVRGDLYKIMAEATFGSIEKDSPDNDNIDNRNWWLSLDDKRRRHATKRITMTTYYSARQWGLVEQIMEDVDLEVPDDITNQKEVRSFKIRRANYFIKHFLSVQDSGISEAPYKVMEMLKEMSSAGDIEWKSPLFNFPVRQRYVKPDKRRAAVTWLGEDIEISYDDYNKPDLLPDIEKHKAGVVANFIHSIDAAHVATLTERANNNGYTCATVHDSYLCKPCDLWKLWEDVRITFVDVTSNEKRFHKVGDGLLNIKDVLTNEHAFS